MTAEVHSMYKARFEHAVERMARLENLIILLEAELASAERKLVQCEKILSGLKITPYHPTMID